MSENNLNQDIQTEKKPKRDHRFAVGFFGGMLVAFLAVASFSMGSKIYKAVKISQSIDEVEKADTTAVTKNEELVSAKLVKKIGVMESLIDKYYLDEYTTDDLENGVYRGMVDALGDKYGAYYSTEEVRKLNEDTGGYYGGIGAYIGYDEEMDMCFIAGVMEDSPAEEVGLKDGDFFYYVDGESVKGLNSTELVKLVRGPEGTKVHLSMYREGEDQLIEVDITRKKIDTLSVGYKMLEDNIGYIAITEFDTNTSDQFIEALAVLKGQGARGIIIDVRSNLGGDLAACCEICEHILPEGMIVYTMDKNGKKEEHLCDGKHPLDLPLVVLTNAYSASASEILTGAVKDHGVGTIMGTTTFGKGIVQKIIPMSDGSAIKLTSSKYYTPNGVCIHGVGIEPDIVVEFDADAYYNDGVDNQLNAAIDEIHHKWENAE